MRAVRHVAAATVAVELADLDEVESGIADQASPRGRVRVSTSMAHGRMVIVPLPAGRFPHDVAGTAAPETSAEREAVRARPIRPLSRPTAPASLHSSDTRGAGPGTPSTVTSGPDHAARVRDRAKVSVRCRVLCCGIVRVVPLGST